MEVQFLERLNVSIDCLRRQQVQAQLPHSKQCKTLYWRLLNSILTTLNNSLRTSPETNFRLIRSKRG